MNDRALNQLLTNAKEKKRGNRSVIIVPMTTSIMGRFGFFHVPVWWWWWWSKHLKFDAPFTRGVLNSCQRLEYANEDFHHRRTASESVEIFQASDKRWTPNELHVDHAPTIYEARRVKVQTKTGESSFSFNEISAPPVFFLLPAIALQHPPLLSLSFAIW